MALFESYERRIDKINEVLNSYGIASLEEAEKITKDAGLDVYNQIKGIQPICFENACWAYITGAAIAIKKRVYKSSRRGSGNRRRTAGILYSRFGCRSEKSRLRTWKPWQNASGGGDRLLRIPCRA